MEIESRICTSLVLRRLIMDLVEIIIFIITGLYKPCQINKIEIVYCRFPEDEVYYRGMGENNNVDQLRIHGNIQKLYSDEKATNGRNFAWSEDEKVKS